MKLFVKTPTGRTISLIRVQPSDTLHSVQAKIQKKHRLVFDGVELEDYDRTLEDYGIKHKSTLSLEEGMQIYVRDTLRGLTITVEVDDLDTIIGDVKSKIQDLEGFPKGQQCLIFADTQLEDHRTLADLDVCKESTLLLVLRPASPGGKMQIFVKMVDGKVETFEVESSDTVESLMVKVYQVSGSTPRRQRLIFGGQQLDSGRTLADYKVQAGATIHLVLRLCGC